MKQNRTFLLLTVLLFIFCIQISVAQDDPEVGEVPRRDDPRIEVDVNEMELEIHAGQIDSRTITITNAGDELLRIETELFFTDQPEVNDLGRMTVLIVTEGDGDGGEHVMLEAAEAAGIAEENVLEVGGREISDIDIYEWDVIVWSDSHENVFYQNYNWWGDRFEEWVDAGGILILNLKSVFTNPPVELPGVIHQWANGAFGFDQVNVREVGVAPENPLINGFYRNDEDDVPNEIIGDECNRTFFWREFIIANENVEDLQIIYSENRDERCATMITYGFGSGYVCGSTLNLSGLWYHQWNDNGADLMARNELIWADWIVNPYWATLGDHQTEIDPEESVEIDITFNGNGLVTGEYAANLHINSNDDNNAEIIVSIELFVSETPDISVEWANSYGFPEEMNWNLPIEGIYVGNEYETSFGIVNNGSGALEIDEIQIDGAGSEFLTIVMEDRLDPIPGRSDLILDIILAPEEEGEFEVMMTLFSNDPDEDEYDFSIVFDVSGQPEVIVDPELIEDVLLGADVVEHELTLRNNGGGNLRFTTDIDILQEPARDLSAREMRSIYAERLDPEDRVSPERDDAGDIIHEFQLENDMVDNPDDRVISTITHALAWDTENEWMWAVNTLDHRMIAINPNENYRTEDFWMMDISRPWDMIYHDGTLYTLESYNTWLVMWDMDGHNLGRLNLDCEGAIIYGLAFDPVNELIIVLGHRIVGRTHPLFVFTIEGEQVASLDCIKHHFDNNMSLSIEWVPTHDFGKLWVHTSEQLWQLDIDTENWEVNGVVQHFHTMGLHFADGFAHDGENFWITSTETNTCEIIDDGINEIWITVDPIAGEVDAENEIILTVTLDSRNQLPGDYEAEIHIVHNDPGTPEVIVPVILNIEAAPFISINWPTGAGFDEEPPIVDWNMYSDNIFVGQSYVIPVKVQNLGHRELVITDIFSESESFSAEPTEFNLEPRGIREVVLTFRSEENGVFESGMVFQSNDPNREDYEIPLVAETSLPPFIIVEPVAVDDNLVSGEVSQIPINIANEGETDLRWVSDFVFLNDNEDERDENT
ncbi:MAG: hypothetical protein HN590_07000, partial [Calditrichaeota bacterium]|nr:hypothetical protein [Calditrichota bacterium]